jgi:hypothetical protein
MKLSTHHQRMPQSLAYKEPLVASKVFRDVQLVSDTLTDAQVLIGPDTDDSAPSTRAAFIAFRGTTTRADWNINSRLWLIPSSVGAGARVHSGFVSGNQCARVSLLWMS